MSRRVDDSDRRIIAILREDGRASNVEIARRLGLAEATVRKRIERLLASGAVSVIAVADPDRLGYGARVIIAVQTEQTQMEAIAERLAGFPEVCSVSIVTGSYDIIVEVVLASGGSLLSFILDKVVTIPGVRRSDTYHVLRVVKRFCDWAVPDESAGGNGHPAKRSMSSSSSEVIPGAIVVPS